MRLGRRRAHHYAHRPGPYCGLRNPETALHYHTKHALASKLRYADELSVSATCARLGCLAMLPPVIAAQGWDDVRVEAFIHPIRPDILLTKKGRPMLAIEVMATNAVSEEKAAELAQKGIPWVEVVAGGTTDGWESGNPLSVIRHEAEGRAEVCPAHAGVDEVGPQKLVTSEEEPQSAPRTLPPIEGLGERWKFRVVDCYPVGGPRERKVYWVFCTESDDRSVRLRVAEGEDEDWSVVVEVHARDMSRDSLRKVNDRLRQHLKNTFTAFHSPLGWRDSSDFPENPVRVYSREFMPVKDDLRLA